MNPIKCECTSCGKTQMVTELYPTCTDSRCGDSQLQEVAATQEPIKPKYIIPPTSKPFTGIPWTEFNGSIEEWMAQYGPNAATEAPEDEGCPIHGLFHNRDCIRCNQPDEGLHSNSAQQLIQEGALSPMELENAWLEDNGAW